MLHKVHLDEDPTGNWILVASSFFMCRLEKAGHSYRGVGDMSIARIWFAF